MIALLVMGMLVRETNLQPVQPGSGGNQLAVVATVIMLVGVVYVDPSGTRIITCSSQPVPEGEGGFSHPDHLACSGSTRPSTGWPAWCPAPAIVFFAFISLKGHRRDHGRGGEEPARDVPIGILGSLLIVTVLFHAGVSLVVTEIDLHRDRSGGAHTARHRVRLRGRGVDGRPDLRRRVHRARGGRDDPDARPDPGQRRDGPRRLLPRWISKVHPTYGTPYRITIITGVVVAALAGLVDLSTLVNLVNIGTLFAFILVSVAVVILRRTRPDLPRAFRTPFLPVVAGLRDHHVRLPDAQPDQ